MTKSRQYNRAYIDGNKFVIVAEPKTIHFNLYKHTVIHFKYEIDSIIKHNKLLVENKVKNEIRQLSSKNKYGNIIHEHGQQ